MSFIISTENLTKKYKKATAVESVSLHVEKGSIYGLIGKVGAGKSTILGMIAGVIVPTDGGVIYEKVDGRRPKIGVLIGETGIYGNMSAKKNMEIKRLAFGSDNEKEVDELLARFGMEQWAGVKGRSFSSDMKKRLGIAMAFIGDPDILILDEPFEGLDKKSIADIRAALKELSEEQHKTVIISGSSIEELSGLAETFGVLENGNLVSEASEEEVMSKMPGFIRIIADPIEGVREVLNRMEIFSYQTKSYHMIHVLEQVERIEEIREELEKAGIRVSECGIVRETMEDYYINIAKEEQHHA